MPRCITNFMLLWNIVKNPRTSPRSLLPNLLILMATIGIISDTHGLIRPEALAALLGGRNFGKMLVRVGPDPA